MKNPAVMIRAQRYRHGIRTRSHLNRSADNHPPACRISGFSLVELMVSMLIGLIILGALITIFANNGATYKQDEGMARIQENGRIALEFLAHDIRMAGSTGCIRNPPGSGLYSTVNNSGSNSGPMYSFGDGIQGYEAAGTAPGQTYAYASSNPSPATSTGTWTPLLDSNLLPLNGLKYATAGSDVLVVSYIDPNTTITTQNPANDSAQIFLTPQSLLKPGQIVVISDCTLATMFQITAINSTGTNLSHTTSGTPGNVCSVWGSTQCPGNPAYQAGAQVNVFRAVAYFVGQDPNNPSYGPTLFQAYLNTNAGGSATITPQPVAQGVENMQILYGVDTTTPSGAPTNGNANEYLTANNVTDWTKVVSVRLALLLRSPDDKIDQAKDNSSCTLGGTTTPGYCVDGTVIQPAPDNRRRRVFTETIDLRNRGI